MHFWERFFSESAFARGISNPDHLASEDGCKLEPSRPSSVFLDLLDGRNEAAATQYVRDQLTAGRSLRSVFADILGPALEKADRQAGEAIERIMSGLSSQLFAMQDGLGAAVCASFGTGNICRTADVAAAILSIDGYEVCNAGTAPAYNDLIRVLDELKPSLCLFCLNAPNGRRALVRVLQHLERLSAKERPYVVAVLPDDALAASVQLAGADVCLQSALLAVDMVHARRKAPAEEERNV